MHSAFLTHNTQGIPEALNRHVSGERNNMTFIGTTNSVPEMQQEPSCCISGTESLLTRLQVCFTHQAEVLDTEDNPYEYK